jgi:peptidoglycan hydrolase-like protein with peptidoglycan-binding domain
MGAPAITRQIVVDFFVSKGWQKHHGYGAASNIYQECSFRPDLTGDGGHAYGLCQWHGDRQAQFKKLYGKPIQQASAMEQLEFLNWELHNSEKKAGQMLREAKNAHEAGAMFSKYYERPARVELEMANRGKRAQDWFDADNKPVAPVVHEVKITPPSTPPPAFVLPTSFDTLQLVKLGSDGSVYWKEIAVLRACFGLKYTGKFDEAMATAVRGFQQRNSLDPDGIVGRKTWKALEKLIKW